MKQASQASQVATSSPVAAEDAPKKGDCEIDAVLAAVNEVKRKPREPRWMLKREVFLELERQFGPFDIDGAASVDGTNAQLPVFCSPISPFEGTDLAGKSVYVNPPFARISEFLDHYLQCKQRAPASTGAVFVLPQWTDARWWPKLEQAGMKVVRRWPIGSSLFVDEPGKGARHSGPSSCVFVAVVDSPRVAESATKLSEEPQQVKVRAHVERDPKSSFLSPEHVRAACSSVGNAVRSWSCAAMLYLLSLLDFVMQTSMVSKVRTGGQLLYVRCEVLHTATAALVDSGATKSFISGKFARKLQLKPVPKVEGNGLMVELATGSVTWCTHVLPRLKFRIGGPHGGACQASSVTFHVIDDLQDDIILGTDWLYQEDPDIKWREHTVVFKGGTKVHGLPEDQVKSVRATGRLSYTICKSTLQQMRHEGGNELYLLTVKPAVGQTAADSFAGVPIPSMVRPLVEKWQAVFGKPSGVPPPRGVKHSIPLHPDFRPVARSAYRMSVPELQEVQKQLSDLVDLGFVRPSSSSFASPVLLVKKADGSWRMCVDYRAVNAATSKNSYPLPRVDELFEQLAGAQYFTKMDLHSGYWQIEVEEVDRHKTAFITRYGLYEWNVMPFGLSGAPATFQRAMHDVFRDLLDKGVVIYLDDVLIYSHDEESHLRLLDTVLRRLHEHHFFAKLQKCTFMTQEVVFLGHVVSKDGLRPVHDKVEAVRSWPRPCNKHEMRSFLGLCSYYRRYIHRFAHIAAPLIDLTRTHVSFVWESMHEAAFSELKEKLCSAPVLKLPDAKRPFVIHTDASSVGLGAVLSQEHDGRLHPVEFYSRKLTNTERRYDERDQEMLAVKEACAHWEHLLLGKHTCVYSDHENLSRFFHGKTIRRRDVRWLDQLQALDIEIRHVSGKDNSAADAFSRRPDYAALNTLHVSMPQSDLLQQIARVTQERLESDEEFVEKMAADTRYFLEDGLLKQREGDRVRIVVPDNESANQILWEYHVGCGHGGFNKTLAAITPHYTWPGISRDLKSFIRSCHTCQMNKSSTSKPAGLLQPLEPPSAKMQHVSMDFITDLPCSHRYDAILTITDMFTKYVFLVPCRKNDTATQVARRALTWPFGVFGLPKVIVSDRDAKFTSRFWRALFKALGTDLRFSTAYHPQTDGQSERTNQTVETTLRCLLADRGFTWHKHIHTAQAQINNAVSAATGFSPAMLMFGFQPRTPIDLATNPELVADPDAAQMLEEMHMQARAAADQLQTSQDLMKQYADKKRRHVQFSVGDRVMLSTKHIKLGGSRKLSPKWLGPFTVLEVMSSGNAVRLELPSDFDRLHDVFNVSLLKKVPPGYASRQPEPDDRLNSWAEE